MDVLLYFISIAYDSIEIDDSGDEGGDTVQVVRVLGGAVEVRRREGGKEGTEGRRE